MASETETELAKLRQELQAARTRGRELYDSAPDMMALIGYKTATITDCNLTLASKVGRTVEQLIGTNVADLCEPGCRDKARAMVRTFATTGQVHETELCLVGRCGAKIYTRVRISPVHNADGVILNGSSIWRDITAERNNREEFKRLNEALTDRVNELELAKERYELAVDATLDGIWEWNLLTAEEYFAPHWYEVLGYSSDDLDPAHTYQFWASRIHSDDRERVAAGLSDHLKHQKPYNVTYRHRHRSGEYRWQNSRGKAIFDDSGLPTKMVGAIRDVHVLRDAEEKVRKLNRELERRVETRTAELVRSNLELEQFAFAASHDLQEPLRMVSSYVGLLAEEYGGKLGKEADEYISFALDGAQRMGSLITGLLELSQVDSRAKDPIVIDAAELMQDALANLEEPIKQTQARVTYDELPCVYGDRLQLTRLFQNLISNAAKFQPPLQTPVIHISATETSAERPSTTESRSTSQSGSRREPQWEISVRDNGIGIEKQHFERVFAVFKRLHTREKYPGTGIGLSMCKKIVERHNGQMWLTSELGIGTSFHFTLPQAPVVVEDES